VFVAFSVEKAAGGSVRVLVTMSEVVVVGPLVIGGIIIPPELVEVVKGVNEVEVKVPEEVRDWDVVVPLIIGNRGIWGKATATEAIPKTTNVSQAILKFETSFDACPLNMRKEKETNTR
jgi:hypothetical protein